MSFGGVRQGKGEVSVNQVYHQETYTYNANSMRTRVDYQVLGQPNYHRLYKYDPSLRGRLRMALR